MPAYRDYRLALAYRDYRFTILLYLNFVYDLFVIWIHAVKLYDVIAAELLVSCLFFPSELN